MGEKSSGRIVYRIRNFAVKRFTFLEKCAKLYVWLPHRSVDFMKMKKYVAIPLKVLAWIASVLAGLLILVFVGEKLAAEASFVGQIIKNKE